MASLRQASRTRRCALARSPRAIMTRARENLPLADSGDSFSNHAQTVASSRWSSHIAASRRLSRKLCEGQIGLAVMKARYRSTDAPLSSLRRMIHSASFLATGSEMAASAWAASAALCLRTSSMTFSSVSRSACGVDDVAATAAGVAGLRAIGGGKAACWRVAGAIAGAGTAWAAVLVTGVVVDVLVGGFVDVLLGTTLRAIGRGFGSGILDFAEAFPANADSPTASTRVV